MFRKELKKFSARNKTEYHFFEAYGYGYGTGYYGGYRYAYHPVIHRHIYAYHPVVRRHWRY